MRIYTDIHTLWRNHWRFLVTTLVAIIALWFGLLPYLLEREKDRKERLAEANVVFYEAMDLLGARPGGSSDLTVYFDNQLPKDFQGQQRTLEQARRQIEKFTNLLPNDPRGLFLTFLYFVAANNSERAESAFRKLQEKENKISDVSYHIAMGSICAFRFGQYERALRHFERAIQLQPTDSYAHAIFGLVLHTDNQNELSISMLEKAIELDPRNAAFRVGLGHVLFESGKADLAQDVLQKAISLELAYDNTYNVLGTIYADLGKHKEAIRFYERAIELSPTQGIFYVNLSLSLRIIGEKKKAEKALTKAHQVWNYPIPFDEFMEDRGKHPTRSFW